MILYATVETCVFSLQTAEVWRLKKLLGQGI